jgi:hypothetical protein
MGSSIGNSIFNSHSNIKQDLLKCSKITFFGYHWISALSEKNPALKCKILFLSVIKTGYGFLLLTKHSSLNFIVLQLPIVILFQYSEFESTQRKNPIFSIIFIFFSFQIQFSLRKNPAFHGLCCQTPPLYSPQPMF